jgi:hypothetical protein
MHVDIIAGTGYPWGYEYIYTGSVSQSETMTIALSASAPWHEAGADLWASSPGRQPMGHRG